MRRRLFIATTLGMAVTTMCAASASLAKRIAIIASTSDGSVPNSDLQRFIARLGHGILEHPSCELLSRTRLDSVLQEQGFSNSAYADPSTAAKLGKIIGASHILHATLTIDTERSSGLMEHEKFQASSDFELIEVSTARIISTGSADGSQERSAAGGGMLPGSMSEVRRGAVDDCAENLVSQLALN